MIRPRGIDRDGGDVGRRREVAGDDDQHDRGDQPEADADRMHDAVGQKLVPVVVPAHVRRRPVQGREASSFNWKIVMREV